MTLAAIASKDFRTTIILLGMALGLVGVTLFSLTVGAVSISVQDVAIILFKKIGFFPSVQVDNMHEVVLISIRLPRIFMTLLVGASLGISGASLQGLFRNPLVEPSLIGVSGGSAALVVIVIVFGGALALPMSGWIHDVMLCIAAFVGGMLATVLVFSLSKKNGKTNIAVLILIGAAVNAMAGAVIGLAIFYADENQLRTFTFWTLGDLGGGTWDKLAIAAPVLILSNACLLLLAKPLNALALGEAEAFHLGVDTERTKKIVILLSALSVGVSVSLVGMIGFIGLIIPHVVRVSFYPDNSLVLPASILGGAFLLVISDIIARTIVIPAELPIGVVTALLGAPFFIGLLINAHRQNQM